MSVMWPVRYVVWGESPSEGTVELFRWCRDAESGISRAWAESRRHDMPMTRIWAVPAAPSAE